MAGTLNALGLIACIVITILCLVFAGRRSCSRVRILFSFFGLALYFIMLWPAMAHACNKGNAFNQILIPCICQFVSLCFVRVNWLRRAAVGVLVILTFALGFQFTHLVHEPGYLGNPGAHSRTVNSNLHHLDWKFQEKSAYEQTTSDDIGWVRDVLPLDEDSKFYLEEMPDLAKSQRTWHTWLTGLYAVTYTPSDVWYLGNNPEQYEFPLELRPRPNSLPIAKQEAPEPTP